MKFCRVFPTFAFVFAGLPVLASDLEQVDQNQSRIQAVLKKKQSSKNIWTPSGLEKVDQNLSRKLNHRAIKQEGIKTSALINHRELEIQPFDPSSNMTSYIDEGSCGPRGNDASADLASCSYGWEIVAEALLDNYICVTTIDDCCYYSWTVYECKEPTSMPSDTPPSEAPSYVPSDDSSSSCCKRRYLIKSRLKSFL